MRQRECQRQQRDEATVKVLEGIGVKMAAVPLDWVLARPHKDRLRGIDISNDYLPLYGYTKQRRNDSIATAAFCFRPTCSLAASVCLWSSNARNLCHMGDLRLHDSTRIAVNRRIAT